MSCPGSLLLEYERWENEGGKDKPIQDPFLGKCIHGIGGASMGGGVLVNPTCKECERNGRAG